MQKWEYKTIMLQALILNRDAKNNNQYDVIGQCLNIAGTDGWELVVTLDKNNEGNVIAIFKRPC